MLDWLLEGAQSLASSVGDFFISIADWSFSFIANSFTKLFDFALSAVSAWLG